MFFINKYYIASVWRAELDQKRRYIERYETNSNKTIRGVFGDTNLTKIHRNYDSVVTRLK